MALFRLAQFTYGLFESLLAPPGGAEVLEGWRVGGDFRGQAGAGVSLASLTAQAGKPVGYRSCGLFRINFDVLILEMGILSFPRRFR